MVLAGPESRPGPLPGPHARARAEPAVRQTQYNGIGPFTGPPKPYQFRYGVADVKSGSNFDHAQQQEASGVVRGNNTTVVLPKEDWTLEWTLLCDFSKSETRWNIKRWY